MSFVETYATDDAVALAARIRAKEVSPREAVAAAFAAIDRVDPALNAVIMRMEAQAEELRVGMMIAGITFPLAYGLSGWTDFQAGQGRFRQNA